MAAGRIAAPGTSAGPCEDIRCGHIDCIAVRRWAASSCLICGQPLGYETHIYQHSAGMFIDNKGRELEHVGYVHADCLEAQAES